MSHKRKILGKLGEQLAADYLSKKRFCIVERNVFTSRGEIDIIALHQTTLVFVEVRVKGSLEFGLPVESIDRRKLGRMRHAASCYLARSGMRASLYRFDAIGILLMEGNEPQIQHYENIYTREKRT